MALREAIPWIPIAVSGTVDRSSDANAGGIEAMDFSILDCIATAIESSVWVVVKKPLMIRCWL